MLPMKDCGQAVEYAELFSKKPDRDYGKHMEQQPRNIVPSEMSVEQINTRLTLIQRSERFGDGNVAAEIENGNLLKMLLRLDDLLNKSVKN